MTTAILLTNLRSSRNKSLQSLISSLRTAGFELKAIETKVSEFAAVIKSYKDSIDMVIAAGGDGTVAAVVQCLVSTSVPLGILPLGTANNFARNIGLPLDINKCVEILKSGKPKLADCGMVNDKLFVNVVGIGLSTEVNSNVTGTQKARWGVLAYVGMAVKQFRTMKPIRAKICIDDEVIEQEVIQITVCNGRFFGAGVSIANTAAIDDSRLHIFIAPAKNIFMNVILRRFTTGLPIRDAKALTIETEKNLKIDIDGEVSSSTPANFRILSQAILVIGPNKEKN